MVKRQQVPALRELTFNWRDECRMDEKAATTAFQNAIQCYHVIQDETPQEETNTTL